MITYLNNKLYEIKELIEDTVGYDDTTALEETVVVMQQIMNKVGAKDLEETIDLYYEALEQRIGEHDKHFKEVFPQQRPEKSQAIIDVLSAQDVWSTDLDAVTEEMNAKGLRLSVRENEVILYQAIDRITIELKNKETKESKK